MPNLINHSKKIIYDLIVQWEGTYIDFYLKSDGSGTVPFKFISKTLKTLPGNYWLLPYIRFKYIFKKYNDIITPGIKTKHGSSVTEQCYYVFSLTLNTLRRCMPAASCSARTECWAGEGEKGVGMGVQGLLPESRPSSLPAPDNRYTTIFIKNKKADLWISDILRRIWFPSLVHSFCFQCFDIFYEKGTGSYRNMNSVPVPVPYLDNIGTYTGIISAYRTNHVHRSRKEECTECPVGRISGQICRNIKKKARYCSCLSWRTKKWFNGEC